MYKFIILLVTIPILWSPFQKISSQPQTGGVSIEQFGAKANDASFDNAPAIINALKASRVIIFPPGKTYTILSAIQISGLSGRTIMADHSTLIKP